MQLLIAEFVDFDFLENRFGVVGIIKEAAVSCGQARWIKGASAFRIEILF
jgi:hypothetical protein